MKQATRRAVLLGGASAAVGLAAAPFVLPGMEGFLRRVIAAHFGEEMLKVEGIDGFIAGFIASAGENDAMKRLAAEAYFIFRGDRIHRIGAATAFEERFLRSILTRSNIVALYQGRAGTFDWLDPNPWEPQCGLYLGAMAEEEA